MRKSGKVLSLLTCFECTFLSHDFKCIQILVSAKIPLNLPQKRMKPRKLLNVCIFFHYHHIIDIVVASGMEESLLLRQV